MMPQIPAYFDHLIESFTDRKGSRHVHLGHWEEFVSVPQCLLAESVDSPQRAFEAAQRRLDAVMISMASLKSGQTVLDAGCGFGGLLQGIDGSLSDMHLTGVNIDPRQLDICQRIRPRFSRSMRWVEADACSLPFAANSFDCVFCIEAMFHFESRRLFFEEAMRVLRPGGRFVATDILLTPIRQTPETPRFLLEAVLKDGYGPWPDPWGLSGTASELAHAVGFQDVVVVDATLNTQPTYAFIVPDHLSGQNDPGDSFLRALLLLRWLHHHGGLRYEYITGLKPDHSETYQP